MNGRRTPWSPPITADLTTPLCTSTPRPSRSMNTSPVSQAIVTRMGDYAPPESKPGGRSHLDINGAPVRSRFLDLDPAPAAQQRFRCQAGLRGGSPAAAYLIAAAISGRPRYAAIMSASHRGNQSPERRRLAQRRHVRRDHAPRGQAPQARTAFSRVTTSSGCRARVRAKASAGPQARVLPRRSPRS